jgi:rubrerythrin
MPDLKGTKTEQNLMEAFAGESQARNKYTFYASVAKKEGFQQIAAIFQETADNEKEHAKLHFKAAGLLGDTAANLRAAAEGEHEETESMYPRMAAEAKEEGFDDLARHFEGVGKIEARHRDRYRKLLKNLEEGKIFEKEQKVTWHCRNCGFQFEGTKAVKTCPVCKHPQGFFEVLAENF